MNRNLGRRILFAAFHSLIVYSLLVITPHTMADELSELGDSERAGLLEKAMVKLYFYPINRLLDLQDIIQLGIAGSLGLGAEIAVTENASFGGYYTARETGIAYHGHRKRVSWLDFASWADPTPITKLIPGLDNKHRHHSVKQGYATFSYGKQRYESESGEGLHFKRFSKKSVINQFAPTSDPLGTEEETNMLKNKIKEINETLNKENESALRAEVVAGLVHPYVAIELYEVLDFASGLFFLDVKEDDWGAEVGNQKLRKLGRGIANIFTGILEVPINIIDVDENEGGLAAITYGTARGAWRFLMRSALVGPWEVLTFPTNTESIIEPEFPFAAVTSEVGWRVRYQ